MGNNR